MTIRYQMQMQRIEVEQQRVGADVVCTVGIMVEFRRILLDRLKIAVVQHDVTAYLAQPALAQFVQPHPELLDGQFRVAITLEHQITLQHAVFQFAVEIRFGLPAIRGAQRLQRGNRGEQFHRGGRVDRPVDIQTDKRPGCASLLHQDTDAGQRYMRALECLADRLRQGGCNRPCRDQAKQGQLEEKNSHGD